MNRARIIFIILSVYIFAAFGWWTYAHYSNSKTIYEQQKSILELDCYKATFDLQGAVDQELFYDTLGLRKFFDANYPDLEVEFIDKYSPLNNFLVRPKLNSYEALETGLKRKQTMYIAEGIVMIILLFWGIIMSYRSFRKEIFFKKLQANFLLSITHELKTPLTAMKLYMETLLRRQMSPEQTKTIVENSLQEAKRLQDQVEQLLLSAQLDSHKYELEKQTLNFSELLQDIVTNFNNPRPPEEAIKMDIEDQVILKADAGALEMVVNNLISNGLKYGGKNANLKVSLKQDQSHVIFSISDEGPGISEEDKRLLFNKFYRIGDENTRKTKGTGLGLFIVKHLVTLHNGKISVSDNQPKGTIFEIKLNSDAN